MNQLDNNFHSDFSTSNSTFQTQSKPRKIIHIDMDCFYAAVETKKNPHLKNKPLGIGGPAEERSVLCTANYEARKFGVRAAMPTSLALRKCPQLILLPPDFASYKKESQEIHKIFQRYTNLIEPLSLDEAFLDVTDCSLFNSSATLIAEAIRSDILNERKLTASAGIAPNKFLAKIASDWNKPNGQFVIPPSAIKSFVEDLPIEKIFGVGKVTAKKFKSLNLLTCKDIQIAGELFMKKHFGSRGRELYQLAFGYDDREVETSWERKSLSVESTYNHDLIQLDECLSKIPELYFDWAHRFDKIKEHTIIKNITVKIKYADFKSVSHDKVFSTLPEVNDFNEIFKELWRKNELKPIRLIGIGIHLKTKNSKSPHENKTQQLSFDVAI